MVTARQTLISIQVYRGERYRTLTGQSAHVDETDSVLLSRLEGDSSIVVDVGANIYSLSNVSAQVFARCGVHNVEGNRIRNGLSASRVNLYHTSDQLLKSWISEIHGHGSPSSRSSWRQDRD